jgi:hypothetical protein
MSQRDEPQSSSRMSVPSPERTTSWLRARRDRDQRIAHAGDVVFPHLVGRAEHA